MQADLEIEAVTDTDASPRTAPRRELQMPFLSHADLSKAAMVLSEILGNGKAGQKLII